MRRTAVPPTEPAEPGPHRGDDGDLDDDEPARARDRRAAWFAASGVVVLLLGLYGAAVAVADDRIAAGTRVGDVPIGGLTPAAAAARLRKQLLPRTGDPIPVRIGGRETSFDPAAAGLRLDVEATVDRAGGAAAIDPRALWDSFFGGGLVPPVTRVDQDKLIGALHKLAARTDRSAVAPAVTFDSRARPVVQEPRPGTRLDVGRSAVAVLDGWLVEDDPVELPVSLRRPPADRTDLRVTLRGIARTLVREPVVLRVADRTLRLQPRRYAPALSVRVVGGELAPVVDAEALRRALRGRLGSIQRPPRDAAVELVGGRPRVLPARAGVVATRGAVADALLRAASADRARRARVPRAEVPPDFSTKDARQLRIRRPVSAFSTAYPHAAYRNTNIGRAAQLINGTVLRPGQTFSLNDVVGERTAGNGFVEGYVISDGVYAEDYGGGVSQVATTVFNAGFFAGLEDVEHTPHSFYIDRYPVGREATVAWPYVDLKFRNDTPYGVLLETWIEPSAPGGTGAMHARIWSTKYWDIRARASQRYNFTAPRTRVLNRADCVPTTGYGGFEVDVHRDFYRPGSRQRVRTERFHTTYAPADTVICR